MGSGVRFILFFRPQVLALSPLSAVISSKGGRCSHVGSHSASAGAHPLGGCLSFSSLEVVGLQAALLVFRHERTRASMPTHTRTHAMRAHTHTHTHMHACLLVNMRMHVHVPYAYMHADTEVPAHTHGHMRMHTQTCMHIHTHRHACTYIHTYACTHTHTHTHTHTIFYTWTASWEAVLFTNMLMCHQPV